MGAMRRNTDSHRALAAILALALSVALPTATIGQSALDALRQRDQELEAARNQQRRAADIERALRLEIDKIGDDRRKLNQALIDTAARMRAVEGRISETEARIKPLDETERAIRKSLDGRRATIAEVLAALQRIGRHPPAIQKQQVSLQVLALEGNGPDGSEGKSCRPIEVEGRAIPALYPCRGVIEHEGLRRTDIGTEKASISEWCGD